MAIRKTWVFCLIFGLLVIIPMAPCAIHGQDRRAGGSSNIQKPVLKKAVMCESMEEMTPKNEAAAFPISIGSVFCLTTFDPVPEKTFIYHHWFRRDSISTRIKLALNPPRWSTYSSVRLREEDKGPWRVEIRNEDNQLLQTLRFSITD